jgi:hypothetical protein
MRDIIRICEILRFLLICHGRIRLLWHIKEIHPVFYYESAKFIQVTYLVTLINMRQCERIQNQTLFNEVLKTHVMMLNDYVYEFVSNNASLKINISS